MRFKVEPSKSKPGYWVCSDFETKIVCIFENENFNDNQSFEFLDDENELLNNPNAAQILSTAAREMADWLREFHYCKIFPGNIRIRIGKESRELRTEIGLSLRDLADRSGVTYSNLSAIENGKYDIRLDTIAKLEEVFNKKIDFME